MKDDKEKLHVFDSSGLYTEIIPQTDKAQKPEKIIHKEPTCLFVKKQESGIIKRIHISKNMERALLRKRKYIKHSHEPVEK